jgi:hypothetical protein
VSVSRAIHGLPVQTTAVDCDVVVGNGETSAWSGFMRSI